MCLGFPILSQAPITVAHGDDIGPEIMTATLEILEASGAALEIETIEIGEKVYLRGNTAGIEPEESFVHRRGGLQVMGGPFVAEQGRRHAVHRIEP
jgi:isocitrate/isopropylmalate dehydrogenase